MQELERQFKADGGTFKEYKIGDLFVPMKGRNKLTKLDLSPKGNIPVFSSDSSNNGICGFTDKKPDFIVNETNPVFVVFGDHTRSLNIAETSFCVMDNVKVLRPRYNNILALLYFFSVWKKGIPNLGYARHWSVAVNVKLYLPVINGDIDFDYMESYIHELQNESLIKLNDYLKSNGFDKTKLSHEEKDAVLQLRNGEVEWKEFKVGELFDIHPTNAYKLTNSHIFHDDGKNPVVTNSSVNNGITGYSNLSPTERGNMITYSDTTTSEGIFYQPDDFVGYPHVQGLYPKRDSDKWNEKTLLFFVSLFRKTAGGRFDYANKFNRTIASKMLVSLPITANGEIDWAFMQNLISAESRLAIRGVVEWKDSIGNKSKTDGRTRN